MRQRGFALLSALWLAALLSSTAFAALSLARTAGATARNRELALRAGWARLACFEILSARVAAGARLTGLDSVDLGRTTWCRARLVDLSGRPQLNHASRAELMTLVPSDSLRDRLAQWRLTPRPRPVAGPTQLLDIPGFDSALVARIDRLAVVTDQRFGATCAAGSSCAVPGNTWLAAIEGRVGSWPIRARGRYYMRRQENRLAVLFQELE
jgi:hypothetical protein